MTSPTLQLDLDTHVTALVLATVSGVSTGLGGLVVMLLGSPSDRSVGRMLGFASGVMLFVSFAHLLPEACEAVGALWGGVCFAAGAAAMHMLVAAVPDPEGAAAAAALMYAQHEGGTIKSGGVHSGVDSGGGGGGDQETETPPSSSEEEEEEDQVAGEDRRNSGRRDTDEDGSQQRKRKGRKHQLPSMDHHHDHEHDGSGDDSGDNGGGHHDDDDREGEEGVGFGGRADAPVDRRRLLKTGLVVAAGIALHNFPEGMAVYLSTLNGWRLGVSIALAIACHNVPEGMAVATAMYAATRSPYQSAKWALLSGLAEPLGALAFGLFFHRVLTEWAVFAMLAAVAGAMTHICATELAPGAWRATRSVADTIGAHIAGMAVLFVCSLALDLM